MLFRSTGSTAIMYASYKGFYEIVTLLCDNNADLHVKENKYGETVLMEASSQGNLEMAKLLVSKGARVDDVNKRGETVLTLASNVKEFKLCKFYINKGAAISSINNNMIEFYDWATTNNDEDLVERLKIPTFFKSASKGNLKKMKHFVEQLEVDVNIINEDGDSALTLAANNKHFQVDRKSTRLNSSHSSVSRMPSSA